MKLIRVGSASVNQTPLDWSGNFSRLRSLLRESRKQRIQVLCLPELVVSGYGCEDAFQMPHVVGKSWQCLLDLLPETHGQIVSIGLPVLHRGALFNATAVVVDGAVKALIAKRQLAGDGVHYEPRWFKAWPSGIVETFDYGDVSVPIGDVFLDVGSVRIGLEICEEAWVANRPGASLARRGVDIVMNPSASHFAFGKKQIRDRFVSEGSRAFQVAYLYANLMGNESGRIVFDGQALIASEGEIVARGARFSYEEFVLTTAVVDIDGNRLLKSRSGSFQPLLGASEHVICHNVDFKWDFLTDASVTQALGHGDSEDHPLMSKEEEFTRAVSLGLFDFMRKARLAGYTVSLSGGVDSSAVVTLCYFSLWFAHQEIGLEGLKERLKYLPGISKVQKFEELPSLLITTVYQSSIHSSTETKQAAKVVAAAFHSSHLEWSVAEVIEQYHGLVQQALGTELDWQTHDVSMQNIQARARSPGVWMLANLKNQLLLSTSNRSESAVGYATMDGDTSGGLSPLAGIDKAFLRRWMQWMIDCGPRIYGPVRALAAVLVNPPTAELRPPSAHQTDEDDLMPYDVLDVIERAAIRDKKSPEDVLATLQPLFPNVSKQDKRRWVVKFFDLWCRNQWKRERYAPGFHLDDYSLDPKTWCRFPVLSGGFVDELRQLRD